jgi:hypothetical protein
VSPPSVEEDMLTPGCRAEADAWSGYTHVSDKTVHVVGARSCLSCDTRLYICQYRLMVVDTVTSMLPHLHATNIVLHLCASCQQNEDSYKRNRETLQHVSATKLRPVSEKPSLLTAAMPECGRKLVVAVVVWLESRP